MSYRIKDYERFVPYILALPVGIYYNVEPNGEISIQASGALVQKVRATFPGQVWKKEPPDRMCKWWAYRTTLPDGIKVHIYADAVGPKSCKRIEEQVTTQEEVEIPVTTRKEMREVTKTVVRWECPDGA